jgi:hypothetical protein
VELILQTDRQAVKWAQGFSMLSIIFIQQLSIIDCLSKEDFMKAMDLFLLASMQIRRGWDLEPFDEQVQPCDRTPRQLL